MPPPSLTDPSAEMVFVAGVNGLPPSFRDEPSWPIQVFQASIKLTQINGSLTFEVVDDGDGFDPTTTGYGTGLQGMADRLDAIGGTLILRSEPGHGTSVTGRAPVGSLREPIA